MSRQLFSELEDTSDSGVKKKREAGATRSHLRDVLAILMPECQLDFLSPHDLLQPGKLDQLIKLIGGQFCHFMKWQL